MIYHLCRPRRSLPNQQLIFKLPREQSVFHGSSRDPLSAEQTFLSDDEVSMDFFFLSHLPLVFYYNIRPLIELNQACNPGIADSSSLQIALRLLCHYSAAGRMFSRYNHAIEKLENGQIRQGRFFFESTSRGFSDIPVWAEKLPQVFYLYSRWKKSLNVSQCESGKLKKNGRAQ